MLSSGCIPKGLGLSLSLCPLLRECQRSCRDAEGSGKAEVLNHGAPVLLGCRLGPGGSSSFDVFTKRSRRSSAGVPSPAAERGDQVQDRESNGGLREGISSEGRACVDPTYCLLLPGFSWLSSESHPAGMEVLCSCERWEPGGDPGSGSTECPWKTAPGWALGMFWGTKDGGFSLDPPLRCDRR